tara:strand:- start:1333 stop:1563 length:231 start_codon:yes stop_codon:yes gene_type:complete
MKKRKRGNELTGLQVKVFNNNIEKALRKFKKKVKDSNLMLELKNISHYEKPSEKRRKKRNLAKSRQRYRQIKQNNY